MKEQNPYIGSRCRNCQEPMRIDDKFCSNCSQKNTNGKISLMDLVREFVSDVLNIDNKTFKTLKALVIPGKLTTEYFEGKHKSYSTPIRTFFVSGIILFALTNFNISNNIGNTTGMLDGMREDYYRQKMIDEVDTLSYKIRADQKNNVYANQVLDSLILKLKGADYERFDSLRLSRFIDLDSGGDFLPKATISYHDFLFKTPSEIVDIYGKDLSFGQKILARQFLKVQRSGERVIEYFIGNVPLTLLFMMPFLAILLKLLYLRRSTYYVEHLIFTFHFHTFVFLWIILIVLSSPYVPDAVVGFSILAIFVYFYLALKRFYKQGWLKTFVKFWLILFGYISLTAFFTVVAGMISFVLF